MVVGVCIPRPVDLERAGGVAATGVAQVRRDAAVLPLELLDRIKRRTAGEAGDRRVQSSAGNEQKRKAGTGLLEVDATRVMGCFTPGSIWASPRGTIAGGG